MLCASFSLTEMRFCELYSLIWPAMLHSILYVLSFLAFTLSHSVPSKCWHISFKWSVFISHSLFPLPPPSCVHALRRSWVCLRGINPQTTTSQLHFFLSFFPVSFLSPPSVSSDFYCQRLDVSAHLSKAPFHRQHFDSQTVAYCWIL